MVLASPGLLSLMKQYTILRERASTDNYIQLYDVASWYHSYYIHIKCKEFYNRNCLVSNPVLNSWFRMLLRRQFQQLNRILLRNNLKTRFFAGWCQIIPLFRNASHVKCEEISSSLNTSTSFLVERDPSLSGILYIQMSKRNFTRCKRNT